MQETDFAVVVKCVTTFAAIATTAFSVLVGICLLRDKERNKDE